MYDSFVSTMQKANPDITLDSIGGLDSIKQYLEDSTSLYKTYSKQLSMMGMKREKGILLYGPPGTGKTMIAKAFSNMQNSPSFFAVSPTDMLSKWLGESEKCVSMLFQVARDHQPAIIFIDEIDGLLSARSSGENEASRRVKNQFLTEMEGFSGSDDVDVLIMGATNRPWEIDAAALRRFSQRIYVPLPDLGARRAILAKLMAGFPLVDQAELAEWTEGYSGSELATLVSKLAQSVVGKLRGARYFVYLPEQGKYRVASEDEPGAVERNPREFAADECLLPDLTNREAFEILARNPIVIPDVSEYDAWAKGAA